MRAEPLNAWYACTNVLNLTGGWCAWYLGTLNIWRAAAFWISCRVVFNSGKLAYILDRPASGLLYLYARLRVRRLQSWCEAEQKDVLRGCDVRDAGDAEPPAAVMVPYLAVSKVSHAHIKID